jgi:inositol transporter-like SP family MFS transporter
MVLVGLGSGADLPVSLASISEAAADHHRGKLVGFSQILWFGGIIGANVFGIIAGDLGRLGGQIMFAHVGLVALVVMIARVSVPESRTWSAAQAEHRSGEASLRARSTGILDVLRNRTLLVPFLAIVGFYTLTNIGANTGGQFGTYIGVNVVGLSVRTQSLLGIVMLGVGMLGALLFMRVVDTPWRMRAYAVGAVLLAGSYLIPVLSGFTAPAWIALSFFNAIGGAFAFEAIMKIWSQESFPTLLRSTVQGYVIAIARVIAAAVALVTPVLMHTPTLAYALIAAVVTIGLLCGWAGFRRPRFNAFAQEAAAPTPDTRAAPSPVAVTPSSASPRTTSPYSTLER